MKNKISVLQKISEIQDTRCKPCKDPDKSQSYCANTCTFGRELLSLGQALQEGERELRELRKGKEFDYSNLQPSKENYYFLKNEKVLTEKEIMKVFKMNPTKYYKSKAEWGIPRMNQGPQKKNKNNKSQNEPLLREKHIAMNPAPPVKKNDDTQNIKLVVDKNKDRQKVGKTYTEDEYFKAVSSALKKGEQDASEKINSLNAEISTLYQMLFEKEDELKQAVGNCERQINSAYETVKEKEAASLKYYKRSNALTKAIKHLISSQRLQGIEMDPLTAALVELID